MSLEPGDPVSTPPDVAPSDRPRNPRATRKNDEAAISDRELRRQTLEFLVLLVIGIMLIRGFTAEAYIVPTGSMAPTLLGLHRELICANCRQDVRVGMDEDGKSCRPVCPNCGNDDMSRTASIACNGDRLLVQKFYYDLRAPRRWEVAVFQSPLEPTQPYVKRVVGLPGESFQIMDGDICINGEVVRKSLEEQRAMRIPIYDHAHLPDDSNRFPRWLTRGTGSRNSGRTGWATLTDLFQHRSVEGASRQMDWLEYRHWDPDRGRYGPVRDFCGYNGSDVRGEHVVNDLAIEAQVVVEPDVETLAIRINHGSDQFIVRMPVDDRGKPEVRQNGQLLALSNVRGGLKSRGKLVCPGGSRVEVSVFDQALMVAIDGQPLFDPIPFRGMTRSPVGPNSSPVAIGVNGGTVEIHGVKVYRDVYYTNAPTTGLKRPFGTDRPYVLGPNEFFVLGDNSPVSNDSRFWPVSPVVRRDQFIGKPFLVHLPGQVCSVEVFGRTLGWVPDPRKIRYIR